MSIIQSVINRLPGEQMGYVDGVNRYLRDRPNLIALLQLSLGLFLVFVVLGVSLLIVVFYSFVRPVPPESLTDVSVTLEHYQLGFVETTFYLRVMWDSFVIAVQTTILCILLAYPAAYFIAFSDLEYKNIWLLLIIIPFWINLVIRTYAWMLILGNRGLINWLLIDLAGFVQDPIPLLFSQGAIVVGLTHVFLPFILIPIFTSLDRIDRSHVEAAKNLGANKLQAFYEVTLPQSLPGVAAGVMIVFVLSFGSFLTPILLGGAENIMIANLVEEMFGQINNWGLGSALAVVFVIVVLAIVYAFNRLIGLKELYSQEGEAQ